MAISKTKVITGVNTRLSYFHGWEPTSINNGPERYSVSVLIPKSDTETVKPILDRNEVYSGCYARVSLNFYAFNSNGNKGVACGLGNIQKIRDGESLGGRSSATDDFSTVADDDFLS